MNLDEIPGHILSSSNQFEKDHGIKTLRIEKIVEKDTWAIFYGYKSDNSYTVFFARRCKNNPGGWGWFCPSEEEIEGLKLLIQMYEIRNSMNNEGRHFSE